jgi:hypothetical protein
MAENNLARSRNDVPDFFADGDPLAELARIVGYEERTGLNAHPAVQPASPVSEGRREPAFNLEDELLREFERYDAPRLDPVDDVAIAPVSTDVRSSPVAPSPSERVQEDPSFGAGFPEPETAVSEEIADMSWGDSLKDDAFSDLDTGHAWSEQPATDPEIEVEQDVYVGHSLVEDVVAPASVASQPAIADFARPADSDLPAGRVEPQAFDAFDLAEELETSIAAAPVVQPVQPIQQVAAPSIQQVAAPQEPRTAPRSSYTPSFRMPLANFQPAAGVSALRPAEPAPAAVAKPVEPSFSDWKPSAIATSTAAVSPLNIPLAGPAEPLRTEAPAPAKPIAQPEPRFSELDELLYDVERYSNTSSSPAPAAVVAPPVAVVAPPVAVMAPKAPEVPVVAAAPVAAAPAAQIATPAEATKPAPAVADEVDPFSDAEFELALDDLELDLADMIVQENSKRVEPVRQPAPQPVQPAAAAVAPVAATPIPVVAPAPVAAPAPTIPVVAPAPVQVKADVEEELAFDPALISESEEQPEAIAELDVPALPAVDAEEPPLYRNDYDLDIDAELASLLEAPDEAPAREDNARAPHQAPAETLAAPVAAAAAAGNQSVYADLDDFERALEEDFRRSLATPLSANDRAAPVEDYENGVADERAPSSARRWIAPLAAVGILALGGAGTYAWFSSSVPGGAGNGEPIVIAADSDPVKVAPENPGGKTVPNQDKAVYDRVAGGGSDMPTQQQLISSSEEPVDVVQKTLMPESVSLEGENDLQMTDAGDTEDPRLLPQDEADASQPAGQQSVAVMPRKVKTMIVRADGTLVEQEVDAPAPAAMDVAKVAAAPTRSDSASAVQPSAAPFPTAAQPGAEASSPIVPVSAPASEPVAPAAAPADVATAMPASAQAPSAIEQIAAPAETSAAVRGPMPTARPSQQPVNVVASVSDQGNVRPAATPAAAAAAAAPAAQAAPAAEGGFVIQIASLPSQADAQRSYQNLSNKFGSVIGGRGVDIKAAEIAGKGTFYRVRIPAGSSRAEAVALCERYRSAGGSCLVAR